MAGRATAVIISSRPARKTPVPRTARRTSASRRESRSTPRVYGVERRVLAARRWVVEGYASRTRRASRDSYQAEKAIGERVITRTMAEMTMS
jgi:hypothetical protein